MKILKSIALLSIGLLLLTAGCVVFTPKQTPKIEPASNIQLPALFSDNMVLQQKLKIPVWGTAEPGGKVSVRLGNQEKHAIVPKAGKWQIDLDPVSAGGPYELSVIGEDTMLFKNVLIGEVWVCSGQSNMAWPVSNSLNAEAEIETATYPNMRLFTVERNSSFTPLSDVTTEGWKACSPQTVPKFSAVGYFFGRHLHEKLGIPIGLIHTSWGGTPAEAWTSKNSLKKLPDFAEIVTQHDSSSINKELQKKYEKQLESWQKLLEAWRDTIEQNDVGLKGDGLKWYQPDLDMTQWKTMNLPSLWEAAGIGNYDGIVWFRKEIDLSDCWTGQDLTLHLGPIDDIDITWFNGTKVGSEEVYNLPRKYEVPASLVKPGSNVIAVRVLDHGGGGGLWGTPEQLKITAQSGDTLSLAGEWRYHIAVDQQGISLRPQSPTRLQNQPTVLYNAMIAALIPYAIRGAIWYQGEANAGRAYQYRTLFPTMIKDWRANWDQGDFPFLFVQLANFRAVQSEPVENDWAELREAQLMTLSLANTGMAVTIDIGEADNIHPKNKQDVGKRLALNARHLVYGEDIPYSGPIYRSMAIEGNKIHLSFDHVNAGLMTKGGDKLTGFAIAGADRKFVWADAQIDGETVVVSSPNVPEPMAVRYAWASNPVCNLYNKAGLPASPFRTDSWPGITQPLPQN